MLFENDIKSGIFITFSGNCKKALKLYQTCFGGELDFYTFNAESHGYAEKPVIIGSLISESIIIYGSDMVYDEGRKIGNYLSVFLQCINTEHRNMLIAKLTSPISRTNTIDDENQQLIEVTDSFDVRWLLAV